MVLSSEVSKIREKIVSSGWPKYIRSISIKGLHGINNIIEFKFPVCAIVGENGTGKSTILKLAACAYKGEEQQKTYYPTKFFPDTPWDLIKDAKVDFEIQLGQPPAKKYSIKKAKERWRGNITDRPLNSVLYFDLGRIQPIESTIGYAKLSKKATVESASRDLIPGTIEKISEVMAKKYSSGRYATTSANENKEIGILKFPFGETSQFHQGAGETIITNLLSVIESVPNNSLIVIDEVESSLHPQAQRRLIKQLLYYARVKTLQIVLSTHSPFVLEELPKEARILLVRTNSNVEIIYAPSSDLCLSNIDDELHPELNILVEDNKSKEVVLGIIRVYSPNILPRIKVLPVGAANVVRDLAALAQSGKLPINAIGIVDAEQNFPSILKLPGTLSPEEQIIRDVSSGNLLLLSQIFNTDEQKLKKIFEEAITLGDAHEWLNSISHKLNFSPETLWSWLVMVWVRTFLDQNEAKTFVEKIKENPALS